MSSNNYGTTNTTNGGGAHDAAGAVDTNNETSSLLPTSSSKETPSSTVRTSNGITFQTEQDASWLSRLVFAWMAPMMRLGNLKGSLDPEDISLIPLPADCRSDYLSDVFDQMWQDELNRQQQKPMSTGSTKKQTSSSSKSKEPSLIRALFKAFGKDYVIGGFILKLIHDSCIFVGPQVLNHMILFLNDDSAPISRGLWLTAAVTISQLTMSFCLRHYFFKCYKFGLMIRTAVVMAVYQKALVLCAGERHTRSIGAIQNLTSIDAQRLQELTTYLHAIWYSFFQISLALFFLWRQLGASSLAGVAVIIIMMPVTKTVAQWMGGLQRKLMTSKDKRVEVNSEVLSSMKVIKLQAWEVPFVDRIMGLREDELHHLFNYIVAQALSFMLWSAVPLAVALATFAAYVMSGHDLDVATALTSLALFDILRFPLFMLPQIINRIVEAGVSLGRVRSFLLGEDHQPVEPGNLLDIGVQMMNLSAAYESLKPRSNDDNQTDPLVRELEEKRWELTLLQSQLDEAENRIKELLEGQNGNKQQAHVNEEGMISCAPTTSMLCLKRIDFECRPGELIAVVGGVGCGKSSLLNGILGELRYLSGSNAVMADRLAFFSQTPFILNATVRDNILFGHVNEPVDEERYQRALASCALKRDLEILPAGDMTEIGEKGITLSGGQKARVALARAVYHQADISLIDDALSAVDAHVAKHIFEECIVKELLSKSDGKRSVILATNALQHLNHPRVDKIVVMQGGRIVEQGSYKELSRNKKSEFSRFLKVLDETGVSSQNHMGGDTKASDSPSKGRRGSEKATKNLEEPETNKIDSPKKKDNRLMTTEERSIGHVTSEVYLYWAKAAGGGAWVPFSIVLIYGLVELISVASKWWLTYWGQMGSESNQIFFLSIYALINLVNVIAIFLRIIFLMILGLRASRKMFGNLLEVVMHAPMSFFDTTPIGRIVNRFAQDMYVVDSQLMTALRSYLTTIMNVASTIVVISSVTPVFLACLIPIIMFYGSQQAFFTRTYREIKRLDSVNRSPIFALLAESVDGNANIRAYDAAPTLMARMKSMVDLQQNAYYLLCVSQCWLAIRLELVGTLFISLACLLAVGEHWFQGANEKFAGLAGLSITYALSVTQSLNWSVRMASDLEASMVAVERVREYTRIEDEAPRDTEKDKDLPKDWPSDGEIIFQNASLRYRPGLPLVLKGLDIVIPPHSKVGVVGRTGAGKSTLMVALLRIVELDSGRILIDGQDIREIGLTKLRKAIAVIPQDPVLFSGSIRSNLDPFDDFSDADLIDVLTRVGLFTTMDPSSSGTSLSSLGLSQINSLTDVVKENGSNFSVGQRQLLVIARALLVGSSIVIMDEATASVDADTDARIQKVMRSEFANATTITVAHRINTIMDSTHVLTMDNGQAAEFDTPKNLLKKGGLFRDLVQASTHTT